MARVLSSAAGWVLPLGLVAALVSGAARLMPVRVAGLSMAPALVAGDIVLVRRAAPVAEGDIALIREPGHGPVLHRVVGQEAGGSWLTRGDANATPDRTPVRSRHVLGKAVAVVPVGGLALKWRQVASR